MKFGIPLLAFTLTGLGCTSYDALEPLPIAVTITADKPDAVVADSVLFTFSARGGNLLALRIDFGDTNIEEHSLGSARSATLRIKHAFGTPGTYEVKAFLSDVYQGQKTANTSVRIR